MDTVWVLIHVPELGEGLPASAVFTTEAAARAQFVEDLNEHEGTALRTSDVEELTEGDGITAYHARGCTTILQAARLS